MINFFFNYSNVKSNYDFRSDDEICSDRYVNFRLRAPPPPLLSRFKSDNVYTELNQNLLSFLGYAIWNDLSDKKPYVKAVLAFEYLEK